MAKSPSHRFGQIIGEILERSLHPALESIAHEHGLYLDAKRARQARQGKRKVAWKDDKGNTHDLDYVLERGGSEEHLGSPKAFVEIAWRRYTKHSRNKAQEIQGAIIPLAESYRDAHPFLGVVLAGDFTSGSLTQLRSHRFTVLHFPYESVVAAFKAVRINAAFDEDTSDAQLLKKVRQYELLNEKQQERIAATLRKLHQADLNAFIASLRVALTRTIVSVYVLPLHGTICTLTNVGQAIAYIESVDEAKPGDPFVRYEIGVRYSNGDEIKGQFKDKTTAIQFLGGMR